MRLCAVLLLTTVASCRPVSERQAGEVEITLWSMWSGQEERNFERVLRLYEREHPGIRIRNLGAVSDDTKTIRALVAGAPPDFFTLANPAYLGALAHNHAIRPRSTTCFNLRTSENPISYPPPCACAAIRANCMECRS